MRARLRTSPGRTPFPVAALALALPLAPALQGCRDKDKDSGRDAFASAPYVQDVTPHSIVVAVVTGSPRRLRVDVEPAGTPGERRSIEEPEAGTIHGLRIDGLEPDSAYAYRVVDLTAAFIAEGGGVGVGADAGGAVFRTAPLPGPAAREVRIAAVGDSGPIRKQRTVFEKLGKRIIDDEETDRFTQGVVAAAIAADEPDIVLHTGDVVYPVGARAGYAEAFFRPFAGVIDHIPLFATIGNHDAKTEAAAPYLEVFHLPVNSPAPERYYSFDYGPVHVTVLDTDTSPLEPDGEQARWLAEDLAGASLPGRPPWKLVMFHRPPFDDGEHGDALLVRDGLVPIFERFGVDLVVNGHDHNYQRFYPRNGVTYVVTGGGGKSLYPVQPSARLAAYAVLDHFVRLTVGPERLALEALTPDGMPIDSFAIEKAVPR